jgi:hypothetical protein
MIFTNAIKMSGLDDIINRIGRDKDYLTIVMGKKARHKSNDISEEMIINSVDTLMDIVCGTMDKYPATGYLSDNITPIYVTGRANYPDKFTDIIKDAAVSYDDNNVCYSVMLDPKAYTSCVAPYSSVYTQAEISVMNAVDAITYDDGNAVIVTDANDGSGPSIERCHKIACSVLFNVVSIANTISVMTS